MAKTITGALFSKHPLQLTLEKIFAEKIKK
jgi:hypothetical protein